MVQCVCVEQMRCCCVEAGCVEWSGLAALRASQFPSVRLRMSGAQASDERRCVLHARRAGAVLLQHSAALSASVPHTVGEWAGM